MSLTYGSFGDIITTVQLAGRLLQALSESRGSARQFRELVVELRVFHRVLDSLLLSWQEKKQGPGLDALTDIIQPVMLDCQAAIKAFLDKAITKYGRGLIQPTGSKRSFNDIRKMIQWNLLETETVSQLREKLRRAKETIDLVHLRAQDIVQEHDHNVVTERLNSMLNIETEIASNLDKRLDDLVNEVAEQSRVLTRVDNNMRTMLSTVTTMNAEVFTMRNAVNNIDDGMQFLIRNLSLNFQNILYLEDALGCTLPISLDVIRSWETIDSIMRDRFREHPGRDLVIHRRYTLQDEVTGKDIKRNTPFYLVSRPNQRLNMVMILHTGQSSDKQAGDCHPSISDCPRCHYINTIIEDDADVDIRCGNPRCGLIYRRVVDITGMEDTTDPASALNPVNVDDDDEHAGQLTETTVTDSILATNSETPILGLDDFKRARFLTSWWALDESKGTAFGSMLKGIRFWNINGNSGFASMAVQQLKQLVHSREDDVELLSKDIDIEAKGSGFLWFLAFVGSNKQNAKAILVAVINYRPLRHRWRRLMKEVLPGNSDITIMTAAPNVFFTGDNWEALSKLGRNIPASGPINADPFFMESNE